MLVSFLWWPTSFRKSGERRQDLFWLTVSEVSLRDLVLLFPGMWWGGRLWQGTFVGKKNFSVNAGQEAERQKERDGGQDTSFKGVSLPMTSVLQQYSTCFSSWYFLTACFDMNPSVELSIDSLNHCWTLLQCRPSLQHVVSHESFQSSRKTPLR